MASTSRKQRKPTDYNNAFHNLDLIFPRKHHLCARKAEIMLGFFLSCASCRVRPRPPVKPNKKSGNLIMKPADEKSEFSSKNSEEMSFNGDEMKQGESGYGGNRVMVVVNRSFEAKGALQWALSHAVQSQDTVVLLRVTNPCGNSHSVLNQRSNHEILCRMESMCQAMRPGVQVERVVQEGKEKGAEIVEAAKQHRVNLLVLGKRKRSMVTVAVRRKRVQSEITNYCIQNADCMTVAVRRKSRKYGGYLITTKLHKNFWLLA
ncbi:uncharacterized protein LOC116022014 isoform X2 [Ipomoea triloba]|uniref:uncharacterized protein LOC116022014 isoform X2 n=1 Tax=Ipomoea triloba TaxID=35885 RepID=UPI00125DE882|nr:uncharacterized protein LOC116022014 isoform X2 [Ipomoea triloba]